MKLIAFYLPQYHRIKENDEWWGEGYTEWTAVKRARPLFRNHYQPREPYGDNYYDLSNLDAARWQQDLAKEFGIGGFCYYHYWFMGRRLLERPFGQMLASRDMNLPFCLSWANQPWTRAWYGQASETLMPQEYGSQVAWKQHFEYLLPAFRDPRYITHSGKPLFIIHDSSHITECAAMLDYWTDLAVRAGLNGIYFVQTLGGFSVDPRPLPFDAQIQFEPGYTMVNDQSRLTRTKRRLIGTARIYLRRFGYQDRRIDSFWNYDEVYRTITNRIPRGTLPNFLGAFTDWDNTPRRKYRSSVFVDVGPEKFQAYLTRQIVRSHELFATDLLFINAWNEWGEGCNLEPDKRYGLAYLQAVKNAVTAAGSIMG
jgi:hypothetical protein